MHVYSIHTYIYKTEFSMRLTEEEKEEKKRVYVWRLDRDVLDFGLKK